MSWTVFFAVILAAALHASWNALAKGGSDKLLSISAVVLGHVPLALLIWPFVPSVDPACWPYVIASVILHFGYQLALISAYRVGDLTHVYPLARGSAPMLVALVSVGFLGVVLSGLEIAAVVIIGIGIISLGLTRQSSGAFNLPATGFALLTGLMIASYSLIDGLGARAAGTGPGFYVWVTVWNAPLWIVYLLIHRPSIFRDLLGPGRFTFLVGGSASFAAYAIVTWAFIQAPIALVTALRETSVIFALLIGVIVLKERLDLPKLVSTFVTLLGAAMLRLAR